MSRITAHVLAAAMATPADAEDETVLTRDDIVLLHQGDGCYVGIVGDHLGDHWLVDFGGDGPGAWLLPKSLTKLPAGTPVLRNGDTARISCDSPVFPCQCGTVEQPDFRTLDAPHGDTFGYWLILHATGEQVWVPATELTAVKGGESHG